MGNRPINRNPFRKRPWRRGGAKRPKRWNAAFQGHEEGYIVPTPMFPMGSPSPALQSIVWGQSDVEPWADEQEVTIDRIIGAIHLHGSTAELGTNPFRMPFLVRLGMLVIEESEVAGNGGVDLVKLDLSQNETWEDFEWMWIHSVVLPGQHGGSQSSVSPTVTPFEYTLEVDIRNRRKVGQSDELALFGQFAPLGSDSYSVVMSLTSDLRCVMMSR